jgi:hypothetical protein
VLLGGGIATYAAVSSGTTSGGEATPKAAVQRLFSDLAHSDLIGMLDDLPPGERDAIATPVENTISELKRDGVIAPNADLNHLPGIQITPRNLTYAPSTVPVNDHVQVVQITGGTITLDADAAKLPLAGDLLRQIEQYAHPKIVHRTVNIAQAVQAQGHPVRIAVQKVDGSWYPSLLYTIADNAATAAGLGTPNPADAIPAHGANSPDDAVRQLVNDLLTGRIEQAIELTSPDEDAALHDYGKYLVDRVHYGPAPVHIRDLTFTDSATPGGTLVHIKSLTMIMHGQQISFLQEGKCFEVRGMGQDQRLCPSDIQRMLQANGMTPRQRKVVQNLASESSNFGVVTSESGGKWYVNPIRTVLNLGPAIFSELTMLRAGPLVGGMGVSVGSGSAGPSIPSAAASPTK